MPEEEKNTLRDYQANHGKRKAISLLNTWNKCAIR